MPTDSIRKRKYTHYQQTAVDSSSPSETAGTGPDKSQVLTGSSNFGATLLFNVNLSVAAATGTLQVWVYDGLLASWVKGEAITLPPTGFDFTFPHAFKSDIAGQTCGITVTALSSGNITISACLLARTVGGN